MEAHRFYKKLLFWFTGKATGTTCSFPEATLAFMGLQGTLLDNRRFSCIYVGRFPENCWENLHLSLSFSRPFQAIRVRVAGQSPLSWRLR